MASRSNIGKKDEEIYQLLLADSDSELSADSDEESAENIMSDNTSESGSDNDIIDVSMNWVDVNNAAGTIKLNLCDNNDFDMVVKSDHSNFSDPYKAFLQFMPRSVFEHVAKETNIYADQFLDTTFDFSPRSRYHKWTKCTTEDIQAMVALDISMGMCRKPTLHMYFSKNSWLTATPNYGQVMSRDNYCLLRSFMHFTNNEKLIAKGSPGYDPLFKVRPIISMVENTYLEHVLPGKCLSVDETMLKFTGRLWFKQYLPSKPSTKWGIKLWSMCDSKSGFLCRFDTYVGKSSDVKNTGETLGEQVVRNLIQGFENSNRIVYIDNFFSSPTLYSHLAINGIGACGTVRSNRKGLPQQMKTLKLKKGQKPMFWHHSTKAMLACAWQDTGRVNMLSTVHTSETMQVQKRAKKSLTGHVTIEKPKLVVNYNHSMNGVDKFDQLCTNYSFSHKKIKWYQVLWYFLIETALVNGRIVYNNVNNKKASAPDFRNAVISGLLEEYHRPPPAKRGRKSTDTIPLARLTERHFIGEQQDKSRKLNCVVCSVLPSQCSKKGKGQCKRKQTIYYCKNCPEKPAMCTVPCFETYHSTRDFKVICQC